MKSFLFQDAKEKALACLSAIEVEMEAAPRDLQMEQQWLQGATECVVLRDSDLLPLAEAGLYGVEVEDYGDSLGEQPSGLAHDRSICPRVFESRSSFLPPLP
ncbi:hypothetical protein L7F22_013382 [Adiantum nelumboides]|nr:hypothetical protein [Adiantum nelumboides]